MIPIRFTHSISLESTDRVVLMGLGGPVPLITIPSSSELKMMEVTPIMDEVFLATYG